MEKQCHYDVLGVDKDASLAEIKAAFRKLSMETHPDVSTGTECTAEQFKQISQAHTILSNPKERRIYDLQQQEKLWYKPGSGFGGNASRYRGANPDFKAPKGPKATGAFAVVETMFKPRNFILGTTAAFCTMMVYQTIFAKEDEKHKLMMMTSHHATEKVQAWKNPKTGRWEQPAPWDPTYRKLKPILEFVPRNQVQPRTR